jgi:choline dehydrogenase-like flavoprotein
MAERDDVIIIGTGAGGGTLARSLAATGKKILLLERGDFMPRERENWDPDPVFIQGRYTSPDTRYDADGKPSPAWPLSYDDFEPYDTNAEWLYQVHGNHGHRPGRFSRLGPG